MVIVQEKSKGEWSFEKQVKEFLLKKPEESVFDTYKFRKYLKWALPDISGSGEPKDIM